MLRFSHKERCTVFAYDACVNTAVNDLARTSQVQRCWIIIHICLRHQHISHALGWESCSMQLLYCGSWSMKCSSCNLGVTGTQVNSVMFGEVGGLNFKCYRKYWCL